jgi:(2Fe-2S) ferredoxin
MGQYQKHVFVCTSGKTCKAAGSADTFEFLKSAARDAGIAQQVRVNHGGCMGQCGHGPMVLVYPEDVWYGAVNVENAQRIFTEHLVGGAPVESLRYVMPPGDNKVPTE